MDNLGPSATSLFTLGIAELTKIDSVELTTEINKNEPMKRAVQEIGLRHGVSEETVRRNLIECVKEEAILLAVAKMIEANNDALLKQLKSAGVIRDQ